jgi:TP901 family phage tail tape measure protein
MANAFNLTAEINLRGPANLRKVVSDIRRQLGSVSVDINPRISQAANRDIANLSSRLQRLNNILSQTRVSADNAAAGINNLSAAINSTRRDSGTLATGFNNAANASQVLNQRTAATTANLTDAGDAMVNFGRQSALAVRRFAAFSIVTTVIFGFINALNKGVKAFIDFDREFIRLQQVTGESSDGLRRLSNTITSLSTTLGVASADLTTVSVTLAQAGLTATQTEKALTALARAALAPTFSDLNNTVEGSIALIRQFGIDAGDLESALGSINAVAAKFAVEAGDIISAIQRTGGVFAAASRGVSEGTDALNEFIAVFTSVRATTRESAETIATGLRTIFTRIQRGSTIDALREFGVNLTDLEGKFVGPFEAIRRLSEGLSKLDPRDLRFSEIVEELGGFRQIGKVIPLIQQFAVSQQALKVAQQGTGSLAKDAATAQNALAIQITKVREEFTALIRSIGQSEGFRSFVKLSLDLASALIKLADAAKVVLPALTAIATVRGLSALTRFGSGFAGSIRPQAPTPRGFYKGGLVPGSTGGDSVEAVLAPGEFVLNKDSVKDIGINKLKELNSRGKLSKFQFGGQARTFGVASLYPFDKEVADKEGSFSVEDIRGVLSRGSNIQAQIERVGEGEANKAINKVLGFGAIENSLPISTKVIADSVNNAEAAKILKQDVKSNIGKLIERSADVLAGALGFNKKQSEATDNLINSVGTASTLGSVFEGALALLGAPQPDNKGEQDPFDFPFGLGELGGSEKNTTFSKLANMPVDAKVTADSERLTKVANIKAKNYLADEVKKSNEWQEFLTKEPSKEPVSGIEKSVLSGVSFDKLIAGTPYSLQNIRDAGIKGITQGNIADFVGPGKPLELVKGEIGVRGAQYKLTKRASGGKSDSAINAILTPGEAVIGPDTAKSIGYAKLNRMNYADKNGMKGFSGGGDVSIVPGSGNTDSFGPVPLPVGSYVIRKKATEALGFNKGGSVGVTKFNNGGKSIKDTSAAEFPGFDKNPLNLFQKATIALTQAFKTNTQLIIDSNNKFGAINSVAPDLADALGVYITAIEASFSQENTLLTVYKKLIDNLTASGASSEEIEKAVGGYTTALKKAADAANKTADGPQTVSSGSIVQEATVAAVEQQIGASAQQEGQIETRLSIGDIGAEAYQQALTRAAESVSALGVSAEVLENALSIFDDILLSSGNEVAATTEAINSVFKLSIADIGAEAYQNALTKAAEEVAKLGVSSDELENALSAFDDVLLTSGNQQVALNAAIQSATKSVLTQAIQTPEGREVVAQAVSKETGFSVETLLAEDVQKRSALIKKETEALGSIITEDEALATARRLDVSTIETISGLNKEIQEAVKADLIAIQKKTLLDQQAEQAAQDSLAAIFEKAQATRRSSKSFINIDGILSKQLPILKTGFSNLKTAFGQLKGIGGIGTLIAGGAAISTAAQAAGGVETAAGRSISAVGDALNFGVIGGQIGSAIAPLLGPFGALAPVVGGAVGALYGFTQGLINAEREAQRLAKEQAQVKLGKITEETSAQVSKFVQKPQLSDIGGAISAVERTAAAESRARKIIKPTTVEDVIKLEQAGAQQALDVLKAALASSGKTVSELAKATDPKKIGFLVNQIVQADEEYIKQQQTSSRTIASLRKAGTSPQRIAAVQKELDEAQLELAGVIAKRVKTELDAATESERLAKALKEAQLALNKAVTSLARSLSVIDQSLNRAAFEIADAAKTRTDIISGEADITGSRQVDRRINVLQNLEAFSQADRTTAISAASGGLGDAGIFIGQLAEFGTKAADAATLAANKAFEKLGEDADPSDLAKDQAQEASKALKEEVRRLFAGRDDLAQPIFNSIEQAVNKAASAGAGAFNIDEFLSDALGGLGEQSKKAQELLVKSSELTKQAFEELAETAKAYSVLQQQIINREAERIQLQASSRLQQREALGIRVTPQERASARLAGSISRLNDAIRTGGPNQRLFGGATDVNTRNIVGARAGLLVQRQRLQTTQEQLQERAPTDEQAARQLVNTTTQLALLNDAIKITEKELENLPQNLESAIADVIGEIQQRVQILEQRKEAGAGFAEKLISSTPKELADLSKTYNLLQNTLQGNITTIDNSRDAQKAYVNALRSGQTRQQAATAAQQAFAEENKKALSLFDELSKVAGVQGAEFDLMRADLIENFARATGQQDNQFIQAALAQLRQTPEERAASDPVLIALQKQAESLREEQVRAVQQANEIDRQKQAQLLQNVSDVIINKFTEVANLITAALNALGVETGQQPIPLAVQEQAPQQQAQQQQKEEKAVANGIKQGIAEIPPQAAPIVPQTVVGIGRDGAQENKIENAVSNGVQQGIQQAQSAPETAETVSVTQRTQGVLGTLLPQTSQVPTPRTRDPEAIKQANIKVQEARKRLSLLKVTGSDTSEDRDRLTTALAERKSLDEPTKAQQQRQQRQKARQAQREALQQARVARLSPERREKLQKQEQKKQERTEKNIEQRIARIQAKPVSERTRTEQKFLEDKTKAEAERIAENSRKAALEAAAEVAFQDGAGDAIGRELAGAPTAEQQRAIDAARPVQPPFVPDFPRPQAQTTEQQRAVDAARPVQPPFVFERGVAGKPTVVSRPQQRLEDQRPQAQTTGQQVEIPQEAQTFVNTLVQQIGAFGKYVDQLSGINIPDRIEMVGTHTVEVNIVGGAAFEGMEEGVRSLVVSEINRKMSEIWRETGGELGSRPA